MVWITFALAEPPPFVSLEDAVQQADVVVVGQAQRVEFQALEPGATMRKSSLNAHWVEYRVTEVLHPLPDVEVGDVLRVDFESGGCEPYTQVIQRDADRFLEWDGDAADPKKRTLDPKHWLPEAPQILALTKPGETWLAVGFGATPLAADDEGRARTAKALKKKR